jgi:hypothetical protein
MASMFLCRNIIATYLHKKPSQTPSWRQYLQIDILFNYNLSSSKQLICQKQLITYVLY